MVKSGYAGLLLCILAATCFGQTDATTGYLRQDLSAGFRYNVNVGQNSYRLDDKPGYAIKYSYRPLRWLAFEAGLEQFPRPIGASICCQYATNAEDELFLVPFGLRYVWEPKGTRLRISAGGGGAYLNHAIGREYPSLLLLSTSAWGGQFVASGDYRLTRSGRFRAGLTIRDYYIKIGQYQTARILTMGPDFTFSFR